MISPVRIWGMSTTNNQAGERTQKIIGTMPNGAQFNLVNYWNGTELVARSLEYLPHDGVGSIGIPLRCQGPVGKMHYELTRLGKMSDEIHAAVIGA